MLLIVAPILLVIVIGYSYGRIKPDSGNADKLINDYVLYIALPALLFIAVAKADIHELQQGGFILSTLAGIAVSYVLAARLAKSMKISLPHSSILSMGACYGTTGYMGIPILLSVYGEQAALPAAIATILHNIPAIMAVLISWQLFGKRSAAPRGALLGSLASATLTMLKNPLTLSVLAGLIFVLSGTQVPAVVESSARFLGNAAGPTALFALGLGLARLNIRQQLNLAAGKIVLPIILLKLVVQPAVTLITATFIFGMEPGIWLATAVIMAAQPIGAGVYVFARKYGYQQEAISLSIMVSLLLAALTLPVILHLMPDF